MTKPTEAPSLIPADSPLAALAAGRPFDALAVARDELAGVMVEVERALDEAEGREARMARRRRANHRTADAVGRGQGGPQ